MSFVHFDKHFSLLWEQMFIVSTWYSHCWIYSILNLEMASGNARLMLLCGIARYRPWCMIFFFCFFITSNGSMPIFWRFAYLGNNDIEGSIFVELSHFTVLQKKESCFLAFSKSGPYTCDLIYIFIIRDLITHNLDNFWLKHFPLLIICHS